MLTDVSLPGTFRSPNSFRGDVLSGLSGLRKSIPAKYFYDSTGSHLFERICETPEYYPTRTEKSILRLRAEEIAMRIGKNAVLIEPGSGDGEKVRCFMEKLEDLALYVALEISETALDEMTQRFTRAYPKLRILPISGDYSDPTAFDIPAVAGARRIIFFPGSTIGNLDPTDALAFLRSLTPHCDGLLIGVDTKKDPQILNAAYNDSEAITAAFNLNLLARMNKELSANFRLDQFEHAAFYHDVFSRIEMHLVSKKRQSVKVSGITFDFAPGETIHTESSYKYTPEEFRKLLARAGFRPEDCWQDTRGDFSVHFAEVI